MSNYDELSVAFNSIRLPVGDNELYDLSVPGMRELYDDVVRSSKPEVRLRDATSFSEIVTAVRSSYSKHKGDGVIVLSGAYSHMIGGIKRLQAGFNIVYVPVKGMQISTETDDFKNKVTSDDIRVKMKSDIGVVKHLGFNTMEEARQSIENVPYTDKKPTLIVVALNETGLHHLQTYYDAKDERYPEIPKIISALDKKPAFVCYIGEDLDVGNVRNIIKSEEFSHHYIDIFLQMVHRSGIPIEIGAFGHDVRTMNFSDVFFNAAFSPTLER
ncbi:MAG: hypothetical protein ACK5XX_08005 [Holosporales bacterium]|jgi:hypothetical protein